MDCKRLTIIIAAIISLCGCKTQKIIETVVEERHDTLIHVVRDTIRQKDVSIIKDTIIQSHTYIYNVTENGDTTSTKEIHDNYHGLYKNDSTDYYKSLAEYYKDKSVNNTNDTIIVKESNTKERIATIATLILISVIVILTTRRK